MKVRFTIRARRRANLVAEWWRANRPAAPDLFEQEIAAATARIGRQPSPGQVYESIGGTVVRRLLLKKTEQHVYFSIDMANDTATNHTIWGARRGHGPTL